MSRTPARQDKRLWMTAGTILGVFVLTGLGRPPSEQVLTFLGFTLAAFLGQSQAGQTIRAKAAIAAGEEP